MVSNVGWRVPFWITVALLACMANVFFLEKLISNEKQSANLITFSCFLILSAEGLIFTSKFFTKPPSVPLSYNALLVVIFFLTNVANNVVFKYHVPMTLHMIFKSGSLLTSLMLGVLLLNKRYTASKYMSVVMITIGILLCTYASSKPEPEADHAIHYGEFLIGLVLLSFTLFSSSYMGVLQERIAAQFGKHPRENLFYNHMLPLPFFAFLYKDLLQQISTYNRSEPVEIPLLGVTIPFMWGLLICNTFFQYICINAVFQLTSECTSLTVTLVITVRKFLSLLISIFYFGNTFTALHWTGAILVFGGSAIFADLHKSFVSSDGDKKKQ